MADRASASIIIGGALSQDLIPTFLAAIEDDNGRVDWEGEPIDLSVFGKAQPLELCAYELPGGIFDAVEPFCEFHNLPFTRNSGSCGGVFGPERVVYTGEGAAHHFEMNESDQVVLTLSDVRRLKSIDAIEAWFASAEFTPPPFNIPFSSSEVSAQSALRKLGNRKDR